MEKAAYKKLILKSDYARLTFRKFLKNIHRLYKLSADKISAKQFIRYAVANHYTGFLEINLSAEIKPPVPPLHGAGFTNIEAGFAKQVLYFL